MSIFKTTLKVESTNSIAMPVNFTSTVNTELTDDVILGKLTVNSNNPTTINPESMGARGSYLYVRSATTNPKHTAINILTEGGSVATLYTGEYSLIALSANVGTLIASTTDGTADLEYLFGSRGEEIGESVLFYYILHDTATWWCFTLDASTGTPGPNVNTGINSDAYPNHNIECIVNHTGYILDFYNNDNQHKFVFVDNRGNQYSAEINQNYNSYSGNGRANLITWYDGNNAHAIYFNGKNKFEHTFENVGGIYVDNNWDQCAADGTFPVYIENYQNNGSLEALYFIKEADAHLIKVTDYYNNNYEYSNSYAYSYGNFIAVETLENDGSTLKTLEIFNTDGTLLKTVDFNHMDLSNTEFVFYGSGKLQIVYRKYSDGSYVFLNYNQVTGKFIGEDLQWGSTHSDYEIVADTYYTSNSISFKPESVAIIKYYNDSNDGNYLLDQATDGELEVTYIINNDLEERNYVVPSTENNYFAKNGYWYNGNIASTNEFVLLSSDNRNSGPLIATRFTSSVEPTKFTLIENLNVYNVSNRFDNAWIDFGCFGDYRYLSLRKNGESNSRDVIIYDDTKILDKVSIHWDDSYLDYTYNSIIIDDYSVNKTWYFNTSTKKWTLLPLYYNNWWYESSTGDKYPIANGKIFLRRSTQILNEYKYYGIVISKGIVSNEKTIATINDNGNGFNAYSDMSTETIIFRYAISNDTWKVKVFDLNLNFLYEVDTQKNNNYTSWTYGKLNTAWFNNNNGEYTIFNFNKLLNKTSISSNSIDNFNVYNIAFNNYNWFD